MIKGIARVRFRPIYDTRAIGSSGAQFIAVVVANRWRALAVRTRKRLPSTWRKPSANTQVIKLPLRW